MNTPCEHIEPPRDHIPRLTLHIKHTEASPDHTHREMMKKTQPSIKDQKNQDHPTPESRAEVSKMFFTTEHCQYSHGSILDDGEPSKRLVISVLNKIKEKY